MPALSSTICPRVARSAASLFLLLFLIESSFRYVGSLRGCEALSWSSSHLLPQSRSDSFLFNKAFRWKGRKQPSPRTSSLPSALLTCAPGSCFLSSVVNSQLSSSSSSLPSSSSSSLASFSVSPLCGVAPHREPRPASATAEGLSFRSCFSSGRFPSPRFPSVSSFLFPSSSVSPSFSSSSWSSSAQSSPSLFFLSASPVSALLAQSAVSSSYALPWLSSSSRSPSAVSALSTPTTPVTPLPFALFKEANTWVESLIASHIVQLQRRGRRNEPPREGPSLNWDLLADGRILKRQIEGGEGTLYPNPQTNVTVEFSLHTLSGFKIADTRALNTTMMEFPFADAMPGMQIALASMRKLERSVFLLSPEMGLPLDFSVDLDLSGREESCMRREDEPDLPPALRGRGREELQQRKNEESPTSFTVKGGEWLAFDLTLCNIYDRHRPWWRISPDMEFLKNLPVEHIPGNMTHDEWLEYKADQVRDKIQDEMSTNPASPYWEDIEPAMNDMQRERVQNYTARLYGLDKPQDPRRDGSRGFRDSVLGRSGGMRHGCEMGDRMMGRSKHYVWRESMFNFEIVLFLRDGIRAEHITWDITSKRLDIFIGGNRVFGDEFVHSVDHGEGATWTLTEAAAKQEAVPLSELHALYASAPLEVPTRLDLPDAPLQSAPRTTPGTPAYEFPQPQPIGQLPEEATSYTCPTLLSTLKGQLEDLKLPLHQPAMHIHLPKASSWREMWGNPFKFV
ncbi:hypothetical protein TGPRC2_274150 [Toxoplasma gondii TgCatPRC2]|uniref:Uncharacterized protein n=2 Tax=Toxoplasma gondii TaxID=5811 RepID=A0A151HPZ2_TOXGO|nr:hypothetical protein TGARI_274150 [Toxoplasma gondii ARI]KYK71423.1 hypothetical protein TGPRC2_274150 [Toxoplasma gondii TgCatPRC2]